MPISCQSLTWCISFLPTTGRGTPISAPAKTNGEGRGGLDISDRIHRDAARCLRTRHTLVTKDSVKAKPRAIAVSYALAELLAAHVEGNAKRAWLFPDSGGGLVRYSNWRSRNWLPAVKAVGLDIVKPGLGFHDLRRYAATRMFADGVDLRTVMHRLGHDTATLAAEIYAQPYNAADG